MASTWLQPSSGRTPSIDIWGKAAQPLLIGKAERMTLLTMFAAFQATEE
jgi:hypothetical protein